jgi:hypothetical protein
MATPPAPRKPRNKLWWIVLGVIGLFALCCAGSFVLNGADRKPAKVAAVGRIGTTVRDGRLEFVVRSVQCGVGQIGPDYADERAHGQFCLVSLTVKNIGDQPRTLPDAAQKGFGTNGARYGASTSAALYTNDSEAQTWLTAINPGGELTGTIVYDLPRGIELARLELHDSPSSAGVTVDLR